jgi:5-methylcytosine-specific restriction protein A
MTERRWSLPEARERLTRKQFVELFMRQDGRCPECTQKLEMKGGRVVCVDEHINPLWRGGKNELTNRELWCKPCSTDKTSRETTERTDSYRVRDKHIGALRSARSMPCGRGSRWKKKMDGTVVPR